MTLPSEAKLVLAEGNGAAIRAQSGAVGRHGDRGHAGHSVNKLSRDGEVGKGKIYA